MARVIDYAHKLGRKVYVTLNTLIKESELPEIASYLAELEELGPDALLVQDLGLLRMARECFPKLTLHASTQMGFHNSAGLRIARELGVTRVVLERQMTLDEIAAVKASADTAATAANANSPAAAAISAKRGTASSFRRRISARSTCCRS